MREITAAEDGALTVRVTETDEVYLVALDGELDLAEEALLVRELERAESSASRTILLDLSALRFMDSTGLKVLLNAQRRSQSDGDRLALLAGPPAVQQVFDVTGTAKQFRFVG
jgi:anti-sigma B factor antagonist